MLLPAALRPSVATASPAPVTGGGKGLGSQARARALSQHRLQLHHHRARKGARRWASETGGEWGPGPRGLRSCPQSQAAGQWQGWAQNPGFPAPDCGPFSDTELWKGLGVGGNPSAFFPTTLEQPLISSPVAFLPTQELCCPEHSQWILMWTTTRNPSSGLGTQGPPSTQKAPSSSEIWYPLVTGELNKINRAKLFLA